MKKNQVNEPFRYSGNKKYLINYINSLIPKNPQEWFYIEPFLGSGTIFYNLDKTFKWSYLTDLDNNIVNLHQNFINFAHDEYKQILDWINDSFGNIKTNKEAYYNLRENYNNTQDKYKNLKLLCLANSCINSMLRFGPNGMNQSFGARHYILSEKCWDNIKERLKLATLKNRSYLDTFKMIKDNANLKWFLFLDPPYVDREMTYNKNFNRTEFIKNLKELTNFKTKIIYTDIENEESDELLNYGFQKRFLRIMRNTGPLSDKGITKEEVLYERV